MHPLPHPSRMASVFVVPSKDDRRAAHSAQLECVRPHLHRHDYVGRLLRLAWFCEGDLGRAALLTQNAAPGSLFHAAAQGCAMLGRHFPLRRSRRVKRCACARARRARSHRARRRWASPRCCARVAARGSPVVDARGSMCTAAVVSCQSQTLLFARCCCCCCCHRCCRCLCCCLRCLCYLS